MNPGLTKESKHQTKSLRLGGIAGRSLMANLTAQVPLANQESDLLFASTSIATGNGVRDSFVPCLISMVRHSQFYNLGNPNDSSLKGLVDDSDRYLFNGNGNESLESICANPFVTHFPSLESHPKQSVSITQQCKSPCVGDNEDSQMEDAPVTSRGEDVPIAALLVESLDIFSIRKRGRDIHTGEAAIEIDQKHSRELGYRYGSVQMGQWSDKFNELCAFKKETGHCLVRHKYKKNRSLARWVKRQRYQYKLMQEGLPSTLSEQRIKILQEVGFVWDFQGDAWIEKIADLLVYRAKHSNCDVPCNYSENTRLATWVKCQRRQHKLLVEGKPSSMTMERIHELESLGMRWGLRAQKKRRVL